MRAPLGRVCAARSGDKGGNANVGLWARDAAGYQWLRGYLTTERLRSLLPEAKDLEVRRFELPNLRALNFVIDGLLGEGVASSTRPDPQAKGLGEYLRSRLVTLPAVLVEEAARRRVTRRRAAMTEVGARPAPAPRRRDPERRQRILAAAAGLVAERGYHEVAMSDIGAAAGIVGSGIYRHFDGKSAVLVALFDRVIDDLTRDSAEILARGLDPSATLAQLIEAHVRIVLEDRTLMRVYHAEIASLPPDDSRRLRRKQRLYIEEWVHVLELLRPEADDAALRALVHAAIGAVQSTLFYSSGLPGERLSALMAAAARATLFVPIPAANPP